MRGHCPQDRRVQLLRARARHRPLDREAAELMPKPERLLLIAQQAACNRFVSGGANIAKQRAREPGGCSARQ